MVQRALLTVVVAVTLGVAPARAAVYLLDNARHHIGDGLFAPWSADARMLHLPTIGPKYAVAFCLTVPSQLQVVVANVMGVEKGKSEGDWLAVPLSMGLALPQMMARAECCGAAVALRTIGPEGPGAPIGLGRLRPEHNHQGFHSPWTRRLAAGPYLLTIESRPIPWTVPGDLDDLEFIGIGVAAQEAGAAVWPMGRAIIYRDRIPLDAVPPLPCPPKP
ncbi:MAG: hypothetical protein ACE5KY_03355 [Candidatus Tectimicrobiota bacterium]